MMVLFIMELRIEDKKTSDDDERSFKYFQCGLILILKYKCWLIKPFKVAFVLRCYVLLDLLHAIQTHSRAH